jgi:hypothetical protein
MRVRVCVCVCVYGNMRMCLCVAVPICTPIANLRCWHRLTYFFSFVWIFSAEIDENARSLQTEAVNAHKAVDLWKTEIDTVVAASKTGETAGFLRALRLHLQECVLLLV